MGASSLLILHHPEIDERFRALNKRLGEDRGLRDWYVNDPARVILSTVFPEQEVASAEVNRGNRLLYSLLSNQGFMEWADRYQAELIGKAKEATQLPDPEQALRNYLAMVDRGTLHNDIAEAVARFADAEIVAALTWRPDSDAGRGTLLPGDSGPGPRADVAVDVETFVYAVAAVAVFAVAVAAVFIEEPDSTVETPISRIDVQNVARQLAGALQERGQQLRESGALTDFRARNAGYIR